MAPPTASNSRPETNSPQLPKITITAVHRDSLAKPRHVTIPSNEQQIFTAHPSSPEPLNSSVAAGNSQTKSTTLTVPSNPPPSGHRSDAECGSATDESYADWMSRFCFEPPGDARACCEGCFIPFALFGKTHWRLKQITQGGDPLDSNWHSKDGCNGCCWAWLGLRLLSFDFVLTGFDRVRIRATYGIRGNCPQDFARAFFCPCCTLMQNDREIRAREGQMRLRNSGAYNMQVEMTQAQPAQSQPMRYVSPRQTSEPGASEENQARSAWEDREHAAQSASIEKTRGKNAIRANYNHHKRQDNRPSPKAKSDDPDRNNKTAGKTAKIDADDAHFDRGGAKNQKRSGNDEISGHNNPAGESSKLGGLEACSYSMVDKKPIPQASGQKSKPTHGVSHKVDKKLLDKDKASTNDKDDGSQVISLTHELSECPRQEIITKYTNDTDNVSQQHTLVECSTIEIEDHVLVPQAKPHLLTDCSTIEVDSGDNCSQHTLVECTTVEIEDRTVGTTISVNAKENTPAQHTLTGCETATIASTSTMEPQEKTHLLADCVTIKVDAKKNTGSQNTLSSSDTVVTSTSILEQYALSECETTMHEAQELSYVHDFTDCPVDKSILEYYEEEEKRAREEQSGSARRLHTSNSSFQYALANCPTGHATTSSTARQNRRASHTHISGESHKIRQHRLSSCPVSGTEGYQKTKAAHHVAETHRVVASDDSQATQMLLGSREGKSRAVDERTRSERCLGGSQHPSYTQYGQLEKSSSKEIKSSGSRSGEQHNHSKNKNKADNVAGTSHPKHKKHLKGSVANEAKALNTKSSGSKSPRPAAQSAQHALAQVLASNGGTKESSQKGGAVQSQMGDGSEVRKTKIGDGAPSTGDGHTRQQLEKIGAQEQKGQSGGISGIFSKMTLKTKGQC